MEAQVPLVCAGRKQGKKETAVPRAEPREGSDAPGDPVRRHEP